MDKPIDSFSEKYCIRINSVVVDFAKKIFQWLAFRARYFGWQIY